MKKTVNVTAQRAKVQGVIAAAVATDASLAAAEASLNSLQKITSNYSA